MSSRRSANLHGIIAAVSTPFTEDGSQLDEKTLVVQCERLITAGLHGLVCTGSTGEFSTLTPDEYRRVIELYVQTAAGRVPIIAGLGALATRDAVSMAQYTEQVGADALMVVLPFYGGMTEAAYTAHLTAIGEAVTIPIMYYNIPEATGTTLNAEQMAALGKIPGVEYIKDTSGHAIPLTEMLVKHTDAITTFNGCDTLTFAGLAAGAKGSVWGAASIVPELAVQFWQTLAVEGDLVTAREQWKHLWAISDFLESVNYAAGIKGGLDLVGHPTGPPRSPVLPLTVDERARFAAILDAAGQLARA